MKAIAKSDGQGSVQLVMNLSDKGAAAMLAAVRTYRKHDETERDAARPMVIEQAFGREAFAELEAALKLTDGLFCGAAELA